ncbi:MAG: YdeI/OmpD-associated family protein, partial [Bacteroidales bacterium]|nr:YdeI/OmpD-associated family protein [Bacteroidales bacterium]
RKWLDNNHNKESEIIVGYFKVGTSKPSMTWSQSVDQAICFGWIDGIRKSVDKERYCIRFTPRKSTSIWSKVNIKKVEELKKKGLMKESGLEMYNNRKSSKSGIYSFENEITQLDESFERIFKANKNAWDYFVKQAPSYQKTRSHWIMSAKQETTKISRLNKLIMASENHFRLF